MAASLTTLLLTLLTVTAISGFLNEEEQVLADDSERGSIVSSKYWHKFRLFMDRVDAADFLKRAEILVRADIAEALAPTQLLTAIAARLSDKEWLNVLDEEYRNHGEHNMTVLLDMLHELGRVAEANKVKVPVDVLRQLLWRGVVRPRHQSEIGSRLTQALQLFFDTPLAVLLQRTDSEVFGEYLVGVIEFDWMPIEDVLEDTLSHHQLKAQLKSEVATIADTDHQWVHRYSTHVWSDSSHSKTEKVQSAHETFDPTESSQEEASGEQEDADGAHRVHEANVEVVHDTVHEHAWHGGGFVWPGADEEDKANVDPFASLKTEEDSGKEVREVHRHHYRRGRPQRGPHHRRHPQSAEDVADEDNLLPVSAAAAVDKSSEEIVETSGNAPDNSEETDEHEKADWPSQRGRKLGHRGHPGRRRGRASRSHPAHAEHPQDSQRDDFPPPGHGEDDARHGGKHNHDDGADHEGTSDSTDVADDGDDGAEWIQGTPPGSPV